MNIAGEVIHNAQNAAGVPARMRDKPLEKANLTLEDFLRS